ncbi:uncharacterized protein UV8b_05720 [Ustilaginoidea virens]|uniref:Uncharacterized protein n=1 Tax=Ustilaginoidea virens TaxID=1159556 RepID=A0A8E5HTZ0_USTVR|nr:uncharacterized protein UV8b_05720 [Ustilaginoidea virens]QUC21477.1 hypothetical protein UV8b_05720 [Ustilaginoidea virens]
MSTNAVFLSLAPATSASYPQAPASRAAPKEREASAAPAEPTRRRSSSSSSRGHRILKLGPVHWGEHLDEHKEDYHDISIV